MKPATLKVDTIRGGISPQKGAEVPPFDAELRERLIDCMIENDLSAKTVSAAIARKQAAVAAYVQGVYRGDVFSLEMALRGFLLGKRRKEISSDFRYLQLSTSRTIEAVFEFCIRHRDMGLIIADAGMSKTVTAEQWKQSHWEQTLLVSTAIERRPIGAILDGVLAAMGSPAGGSLSQRMDTIIDKLRNGRHDVIICDEAQFLAWSGFEIFKEIHDGAGIAVVYLGTPVLLDQMRGKRGHSWDQLTSRIGIFRNLSNPERADVEGIAATYCPGLSKAAVDFLLQTAQEPGKLRLVVKLLQRAREIQDLEGIKLTAQVLQEIRGLFLL